MDAAALRKFIGQTLNFRGEPDMVLEVLDGEGRKPQAVLRPADPQAESVIQGDQWGEAQRRVPMNVTIPIYDDKGRLNPELGALELDEAGD